MVCRGRFDVHNCEKIVFKPVLPESDKNFQLNIFNLTGNIIPLC
jgi:hypothetical protein